MIFIKPHKEEKVWGFEGIGEYWYGAEEKKSSLVETEKGSVSMLELLKKHPDKYPGEKALDKFGAKMPLVKILTPKSRLSVQFHAEKDELWVITGINEAVAGKEAKIILGFSGDMIDKHGENVTREYQKALKKFGKTLNEVISAVEREKGSGFLSGYSSVLLAAKEAELFREAENLKKEQQALESFYDKRTVRLGDTIPVPRRTLHALGGGIEVVEPQIPGSTQSTEDGDTYPVRYYFPGFKRPGAKKMLDVERVGELVKEKVRHLEPEATSEDPGVKKERLPGGFEKKGLAVSRITLERDAVFHLKSPESVHVIVAVKGKVFVESAGRKETVPQAEPDGRMLVIPAGSENYDFRSEGASQIIDTFVPL